MISKQPQVCNPKTIFSLQMECPIFSFSAFDFNGIQLRYTPTRVCKRRQVCTGQSDDLASTYVFDQRDIVDKEEKKRNYSHQSLHQITVFWMISNLMTFSHEFHLSRRPQNLRLPNLELWKRSPVHHLCHLWSFFAMSEPV